MVIRSLKPPHWRTLLIGLAGLFLAGIIGFTALAYHPAIAPVTPRHDFPQATIARGAELAALGDCAVCHTAPDGPRLAGGRAVPTPFGTVYATNITPDPATGIGSWSEAAFRRAMQDGISRDGHHLYPVLPYPHFVRASADDVAAIYAYLMTRPAVASTAPANRLPFPLDQRALLAGWNLLFLRADPWQPDPAHDAVWNRGAYLVEAVGHCGACHTPRNALGAEKSGQAFAGGEAEGWYAPPLDGSSPAPRPWTEAELADYLRTGFAAQHGAAGGPMTAVTAQLARVPPDDVAAIATYIASGLPQTRAPAAPPATPPSDAAATLFAGACASCHAADAPMIRGGGYPTLAQSTAVHEATPLSTVAAILGGLPAREGAAAAYMPAFGPALTDQQVADLAAYLRARYTALPPWPDLAGTVARARAGRS